MELQKGSQVSLALDIGGTLTKVGFNCNQKVIEQIFKTSDKLQILNLSSKNTDPLVFYFRIFTCFEIFWNFLSEKILQNFLIVNITATGGGALKYQSHFNQLKRNSKKTQINFKISLNEFETILPAVELLLKENLSCKLTQYQNQKTSLLIGKENSPKEQIYLSIPLILVNIGSGMSVMKLEQKEGKLEFQRLGGSALAGGFFVGVEKIMDSSFDFETFSKLSKPQDIPSQQFEMMKLCVQNLSQIISLYSDIFKIDKILLTGGMTRAPLIREKFFQNLSTKRIWLTEIDGYLGVIGMLLNSTTKK